jgi:hypothetical protein
LNFCVVLVTIPHHRAGEAEKCLGNFPPSNPVEGWDTEQLSGRPFLASDRHLSGYPTYLELAAWSDNKFRVADHTSTDEIGHRFLFTCS